MQAQESLFLPSMRFGFSQRFLFVRFNGMLHSVCAAAIQTKRVYCCNFETNWKIQSKQRVPLWRCHCTDNVGIFDFKHDLFTLSRYTPNPRCELDALCLQPARSLSWSVHRTASVLIDFPPLLARLLLPLSVFRFLFSLLGVSFFPSFLPLAQDEVSRFGASTSVVAHAAPAQGPRSATPQP